MSNEAARSDMAWTPPYDVTMVADDDYPDQVSFCVEDGRVHIAYISRWPWGFDIFIAVQEGDGWRHLWDTGGFPQDTDASWKRVLASRVVALTVQAEL